MQTDNKVLDGMARFFTNAAGAAQSFRAEIETIVKGRIDRLVAELDLVPREEFDALKAMITKARAENDALSARIAALESKKSPVTRTSPPSRLKNTSDKPRGRKS